MRIKGFNTNEMGKGQVGKIAGEQVRKGAGVRNEGAGGKDYR